MKVQLEYSAHFKNETKDHIVTGTAYSTKQFVIFLNVYKCKLKVLVAVYGKVFPMS